MFRKLLERLGRKAPGAVERPANATTQTRPAARTSAASAGPGAAFAPSRAAPPAPDAATIAGLNDVDAVIDVALRHRGSAREQALAHPLLLTAAALARLEKRSRGVDKSVNRHARNAQDAIRHWQQEAAQAHARLSELHAARSRASVGADPAAAFAREQHLYQRSIEALAAYDAAQAELRRRGDTAAAIDDLRAAVQPPVPPPEPAVPRTNVNHDLAADIAPDMTVDAAADTVGDTAAGPTSEAVTEGAAETTPEAAPGTAPEAAPEIKADIAAGTQAEATDSAPAPALPAGSATAEEPQRNRVPAPSAAQLAAADAALARGEAALTEGQTQIARDALAEVRATLSGTDVPRAIARRINQLSAAIAELRDWQTFATAPKREALCGDLRALVAAPLEPPVQAERLKLLRAAWRELGPVTRRADQVLADEFESLAAQAFEPCRAWFAEQAALRSANLSARSAICDQLETYLTATDWPRADIRAAEQILRTARAAWREHLPVDRAAGKPVEARFETLQADLHGRIRAHWAENENRKRALVTEAEGLAQGDDAIVARIERAKSLQQAWRNVGPAQPRALDQSLWTAFRAACDAVFAARDAERDAAGAALRASAEDCAAALAEFEQRFAVLRPDEAQDGLLRDLQERLSPLDALPAALRQPLAVRRSALIEQYRALRAQQGEQARRQAVSDLKQQDAEFSRAEIEARARGIAPEAAGPLFARRAARFQDPVPTDALRRLAVQAELIAGLASPAEDEALRLEVQVARLRGGLTGTRDERPLSLAQAWCEIGPKDDSCDPLRDRFFHALTKALTQALT